MTKLDYKFPIQTVVILFVAMLCSIGAWADDVTAEQAEQQAIAFLTNSRATAGGPHYAPGTTPRLKLAGKVSGLYVFNVADNGGFVIVSNDDATTPVLGFSDSGSIDPNNIPDNMRAWLQGYADEIAWLQKHHGTIVAAPAKAQRRAPAAKADIIPLVSTKWNQDAPFNNQCPYYSQYGGRAATGCVATAMAQVMKYHEWPTDATTGIPGYTSESYDLQLPLLSPTTFDWANMLDDYSGNYTTAQGTAVATLMKYCGWSVMMDYGPSSGSTTDLVAYALKSYFDYNTTTTQFVSRSYYTYAKWIELIYHELANNRPVVYGGLSTGGGHEFVCDGYQYKNNTDYFHINWGWGGVSDNYFVLSVLDPDIQGIGGSSSTEGFHYGQDAVIGIQKSSQHGTIADITPNVVNLTLNSMTLSTEYAKIKQTVTVTLNITNNSADDYDGDVYLGIKYGEDDYAIYDGNNFYIPAGETVACDISFYVSSNEDFDFVMFLPTSDGNYYTNGVVGATLKVLSTNDYVPIHGYYCDYHSRSQFIIQASNLEYMRDATVNGVTFYTSQKTIDWGNAKFDVYLSEVNETKFNSTTLKDWTTLNKVYSGSLSVSNNKMTIVFDTPYLYNGGNLLVGINQTVTGDYESSSWLGTTANGASLGGYDTEIKQRNFLPQTTFDYTVEHENIVLYNDNDNSNILTQYNGQQATVTIQGRNLYHDGDWNTLYLPFNSELTGVLEDAEVLTLDAASTLDDDILHLKFYSAQSIMAGVPYLVRWENTGEVVSDPVFEGVTISAIAYYVPNNDDNIWFLGTFSPATIMDYIGATSLNQILFLGSGGSLYYPSANGVLNSFRAFLYLPNATAPVKSYTLDFPESETTGIITVDNGQSTTSKDTWYTLDGRRINSGRPTQKGIYIVNGRKVVIK